MAESIGTQIVLEYLEKYSEENIGRFMPSLTLARLIYKENIAVYKNIENVRTIIRLYRGQLGRSNRAEVSNRKYFTDKGSPGNFMPPTSEEQPFSSVELPYEKIGIIGDVHAPYHNETALKIALDYLYRAKIDCLLINGDFIDFYQGSKYVKDPRKRDMKYEIDIANEILDQIQDTMPGVKIVFKPGNHDERLEIYMYTKAPELLGFSEFELSYLLHAKERNMDMVLNQSIVKAGNLAILHGHELGMSVSAVNTARGVFMKTKQPCLVHHSHVISANNEPTLNGGYIPTWSAGCLCELHPRYARINKWAHGFAIVHVLDSGKFKVDNLRIFNGEVI